MVLLANIWSRQAPAESTCPLKNNPIQPLTNHIAAKNEIQRVKQEMTFVMYAAFPGRDFAARSVAEFRNMG
ncbi:hypothetical protein SBA5_590021 [Candidatus Sulfotelmatomonas gaucii]|uniref:Uncharacterized protein n=1 Tax=Candidatus Sulfuritelmatomonas gaucii TaxID=2043161 RepID=A0A2N9LVQ3_9BACT|nr:hypothetical protein SBA5_590021 [Candidatus Sulfotelmatomonas gaucii]